ncbi:hypothetical protein BN140_3038 [Methanoculleus bourgensis MS2]|uniref:Uncharacterized protein n=1 Tax=Methanoculleus bourgensis (strain ATCC 43281 / DSM 3045 / OCM 15 / MS2) TaxID=1201294 RepID=W6Q8R7_METBM|nr:hypothetical protein BN140_3038 [Methanoculleus bourgensis MS2]
MRAESGPPCAHLPSNEGPRQRRVNGIAGSRYQRDVYRVQVGVCSQTREMVIRVGFDWRSAAPLMHRTLHCYFGRSGGPEPRRQFNAMERNVMGSNAEVSIGDTARGIPRGPGVSIGVVPRPPPRARRAIGLWLSSRIVVAVLWPPGACKYGGRVDGAKNQNAATPLTHSGAVNGCGGACKRVLLLLRRVGK